MASFASTLAWRRFHCVGPALLATLAVGVFARVSSAAPHAGLLFGGDDPGFANASANVDQNRKASEHALGSRMAWPSLVVVALEEPAPADLGANHQAREQVMALARAVYASGLRPQTIDEAQARVLVGEEVTVGAPASVRELGNLRAALANLGDPANAASRHLLTAIADHVHASAVLMVRMDAQQSVAARIFFPPVSGEGPETHQGGRFDSATFGADVGEPLSTAWNSAVASLKERMATAHTAQAASGLHPAFTRVSGPGSDSALTAAASAPKASPSRSWIGSPWLWGALGGAAALAGAFYVGTRSAGDSADSIRLQLRVPQ